MEIDALDAAWYPVERAFLIFMITVSELGLSSEAALLLTMPHAVRLNDFLRRYKPNIQKPQGILLL